MKVKYLVLGAALLIAHQSAFAMSLCPDGSWVGGTTCTLAPDGSWVGGGSTTLAPDGSWVGEY